MSHAAMIIPLNTGIMLKINIKEDKSNLLRKS